MKKSLLSCLGLVAWCALAPVGLGQGDGGGGGGGGSGGGCGPGWLAGEPVAGADSIVNASTLWDPDGPGPQGLKVVVAGSFSVVGDVIAPGVAVMDVATGQWSPLGRLVGASTLAAGADGSLYAGMNRVSGMNEGPQVLRWSGTAWEPVGGAGAVFVFGDASKASVSSIAAMGNGEVVVSGRFDGVSGVTGSLVGIARWDGTTWRSVGGGLSPSRVIARGGGELIASSLSEDLRSEGVNLGAVARWTGTTWQSLGGLTSGPTNVLNTSARISSKVALPSGEVVVGGWFTSVGGVMATNVARWDGAGWSALGTLEARHEVVALSVGADGVLVALVEEYSGYSLRRWQGGAWVIGRWFDISDASGIGFDVPLNLGMTAVRSEDVFVHGWIGRLHETSVRNIGRYRDGQWRRVAEGPVAFSRQFVRLDDLLQMPDGEVFVGGNIEMIGGEPAALMARWDGARWRNAQTRSWIDLNPSVWVGGLTSLSNGVVLGFGPVGWPALLASSISPWDNELYSPFFFGIAGQVLRAVELPNGEILASAAVSRVELEMPQLLIRWDGARWSALAGFGSSDWTRPQVATDLKVGPDGQAYIAGSFLRVANVAARGIVRWDGQTWHPLGAGVRRADGSGGTINAMTWLRDGRLLVVGEFAQAGDVPAANIAVWNGTTWAAFGGGIRPVEGAQYSGAVLSEVIEGPNGEVIVSGQFASLVTGSGVSVPAANIAVWNGQEWREFAGGISSPAKALLMLQNGELAAAGGFSAVGGGDFFAEVRPEGVVSSAFARYSWTGGPTMSVSPKPVAVEVGGRAVLRATVADGYRGVSVRWRRDGVLITDGPGGASGGGVGGVVSGATGVLASPTNDSEVVLTIEGVRESDAGKYAAEFVNACGTAMSIEAQVTVLGPRNCYGADVAGIDQTRGGDGRLTADDLIVYLGWFFARDARADIAGPNQSAEPDGELTADDVILYIGRFLRGC